MEGVIDGMEYGLDRRGSTGDVVSLSVECERKASVGESGLDLLMVGTLAKALGDQ
jgi:hypothetical protein